MTCKRCEALAEEVEALREELGFNTLDRQGALQNHYGLTPQQAKILLVLYAAHGRHVPTWSIAQRADHEGEADDMTVKTQISRIRVKTFYNVIAVTRGVGYRITPEGAEAVVKALA